jgi:hypothetical protein
MASLHDLIDNSLTDKNTTHSYLNLYDYLLDSKRITATHVLEIGIGVFNEKNGGSIKLWYRFFENAIIYAMDIIDDTRVLDELKNNPRIVLYTSTDAYLESTVEKVSDIKFDMILDDGPHSLESMKDCIRLYSNLLKDNGILIIEDVQSIEWIDELKKVVPEDLKKHIRSYDLRHNKGRYDDIVFTLDKRIVSPV